MKNRGMIVPAPTAPGCDEIMVEIWQREDDSKAPTIVEIRRTGPVGKSMRFTPEEAWALAGTLQNLLGLWDKDTAA